MWFRLQPIVIRSDEIYIYILFPSITVKPCLSSHSKIDKTNVLNTDFIFMQDESIAEYSCILQYFRPAVSNNRS